jgi:hypothetical protein
MTEIKEIEIELFFKKSIRDNNDNDNKRRESILAMLINNELDFSKFYNKDRCVLLYDKVRKLIFDISERSSIIYDRYSINAKAGRGHNYDFELLFFLNNEIVDTQKIEYKNAPSMKEYPECLSKYTKNDFVDDIKYQEFFYDTYLHFLIELVNHKFDTKFNIENIDKDLYLKECFKTDSNIKIIELIEKLEYENMSIECDIPESKLRKKDKKYFKLKSDFVDESISEYIKIIIEGNKFNGKSFLTKISEQGDKLFIFWDFKKEEFSIDSIDINNNTKIIDITHNIIREKGKIKNWNIFGNSINTVVVRLDNNTQYECLLRWKNHKGVLGPAWQIKYVTHSSNIKRFK